MSDLKYLYMYIFWDVYHKHLYSILNAIEYRTVIYIYSCGDFSVRRPVLVGKRKENCIWINFLSKIEMLCICSAFRDVVRFFILSRLPFYSITKSLPLVVPFQYCNSNAILWLPIFRLRENCTGDTVQRNTLWFSWEKVVFWGILGSLRIFILFKLQVNILGILVFFCLFV